MNMTELEYVVSNFGNKFRDDKGLQIVLHGSRNYAQAIIERYNSQFHFAGIISRDPLEKPEFLGIKVLQEDDIEQLDVDLIILTERVKYAEEVYQSIHELCESSGIRLFNMYGLDEIQLHRQIESCQPRCFSQWQTICDPYDMIVFETMDTLLFTQRYTQNTIMRNSFRLLIPWLLEVGKDVRFSLRKSAPEALQIEELKSSGIIPDVEDRVIRRIGEDLSFRILRETYPEKKILYIGNGLVNECILPQYYGINIYRFTTNNCLVPRTNSDLPKIPFEADCCSKIRGMILDSEIISFDIFDTLLLRKTLYPQDVFEIVERKAKKRGYPAEDFKNQRITAGQEDYSDIYSIYKNLADHYQWDEETADRILNLELKIERSVIDKRQEMVELLEYALSEGKRVILTSDMYLPKQIMQPLLYEKGIRNYEALFISCDCKKSKETGLYEEIISIADKHARILHIGDDPIADGDACEAYGIRSVIIPSALSLSVEQGWDKSIRAAKTLAERCLVGMTISLLFSNPFQNPTLRKCSLGERLYRFAVGTVGPLIMGHTSWLVHKIRTGNYEGVMFFSRDGYLPMKVYQLLEKDRNLPRSIYYYANRRSAFFCCADDERTIKLMDDTGEYYHFSNYEKMSILYSLQPEDILPELDGETGSDYIRRHLPVITKIAESSREGYRRYSKSLGIQDSGKYAVVDLIATGSTQFFLSSFLPWKMNGFYYGNYNDDERLCLRIEDYLRGSNHTLMLNYMELENYITSPEPSVDHIASDGTVIFAEETRSLEELENVMAVQRIALAFAESYITLFYNDGDVINSTVPEEMFAAEGCHEVSFGAYDDWAKAKIATKEWDME